MKAEIMKVIDYLTVKPRTEKQFETDRIRE